MSSKAAIADSGTATKMGDSFDKDTCACMWGELYDANDGQLKKVFARERSAVKLEMPQ